MCCASILFVWCRVCHKLVHCEVLSDLVSTTQRVVVTSIARSFAIVFRFHRYALSHKNTNLPTVDAVSQLPGIFEKKVAKPLVATSMVLRLLGADKTSDLVWSRPVLIKAVSRARHTYFRIGVILSRFFVQACFFIAFTLVTKLYRGQHNWLHCAQAV